MLDFTPCEYTREDGHVVYQPTTPNGFRLYYDNTGELVLDLPDHANSHGYTPAVTEDYRHAIRSGKIAWRDFKRSNRKGRR